jgi:fucose 4-O-acetylase-like acetyltransferase
LGQAPRQERLDWVDTARGLGIILVVYGHALRGHVTSGAFNPAWHADVQDVVIYSFHMPLFFFLAGLFVRQSLTKGAAVFLREKAVTLVYPYFLWSVVSVALALLAAGAVNTAMSSSAILSLWQSPVYQYWFLYALAIAQIVALVSRVDWRITAILCVISAVGLGTAGLGMLTITISFYVYFGAGILVAPYLPAIQRARGAVAAAALLATTAFVFSFLVGDLWPGRGLAVARALLGIVATVGVAMLSTPWSRWLALLGTASMAIYVLHTIFSAGLRMMLRATGFSNDFVALVLGTLIGIAGPLAVWAVARHYRALPWLGLGAQPRNWQDRTT